MAATTSGCLPATSVSWWGSLGRSKSLPWTSRYLFHRTAASPLRGLAPYWMTSIRSSSPSAAPVSRPARLAPSNSAPGGGFRPHRSIRVGRRSWTCVSSSTSCGLPRRPAGQRTKHCTRWPPSQRLRFLSRMPALKTLSPAVVPLSPMKMRRVLSVNPWSSIHFRRRPTFMSMLAICPKKPVGRPGFSYGPVNASGARWGECGQFVGR